MITNLLKGILIGLVFGFPAGAVGILCIKRTLNNNMAAGLVTGLASSISDVTFALVGAMGVSVVSDFITEHEMIIGIIGGLLIIIMGINTIFKKHTNTELDNNCSGDEPTNYVTIFLSSFIVTITNPVTIFGFLFIFSIFKISEELSLLTGAALGCGIFIGTFTWWIILSGLVSRYKKQIMDKWYLKINKMLGMLLVVLGVIVIVRLLD